MIVGEGAGTVVGVRVKKPLEHRGLKRILMSDPPLAPALVTTGALFGAATVAVWSTRNKKQLINVIIKE
jgi:hypothetical protein